MNRRSFLAGIAALGVAGTLAACSGQPGQSAGPAATLDPNTEAQLTLFYWDKSQTPTVEANIAAFNQKYPKIKVTTSIAAYRDYWTKLRTQAEGDQLPDVFWMNGPNIQLYASNKMLAPIGDLAGVDWAKYPKALVDLYTVGGVRYGVPKDYDTIACFVNKAIFAKAGVPVPTNGWTWQEHADAAKKIADSGAGHGVVGPIVNDGQSTYYNTVFQAGGFVIKEGKSGWDDPKSIAGLQFWADLIKSGAMPSIQVMSDTEPIKLFTNGQAGIVWGGSWSVKTIADEMKDSSQVTVVPLPKGEKEATVIHGLSYVASAKSKNLAAAKALVQAMTSQQANETEASKGTAIPAFTGTQSAWTDQHKDMNLTIFTKSAETIAVPYPVSKNTGAWADKEGELFPAVFEGKASASEVGKALAEQMNQLLGKE